MDGSGVLYDPSGVSRAELNRLAQRRTLAEATDHALVKEAKEAQSHHEIAGLHGKNWCNG